MADTPKEYNEARMRGFQERRAAEERSEREFENTAGKAYIQELGSRMKAGAERAQEKAQKEADE